MHELSIIQSVATSVTEWLSGQPPGRISKVTPRVGALSGVVEDSLQFGYEIATAGTPLVGSTLFVEIFENAARTGAGFPGVAAVSGSGPFRRRQAIADWQSAPRCVGGLV